MPRMLNTCEECNAPRKIVTKYRGRNLCNNCYYEASVKQSQCGVCKRKKVDGFCIYCNENCVHCNYPRNKHIEMHNVTLCPTATFEGTRR